MKTTYRCVELDKGPRGAANEAVEVIRSQHNDVLQYIGVGYARDARMSAWTLWF